MEENKTYGVAVTVPPPLEELEELEVEPELDPELVEPPDELLVEEPLELDDVLLPEELPEELAPPVMEDVTPPPLQPDSSKVAAQTAARLTTEDLPRNEVSVAIDFAL